jgi:hypothetical protein
MAFRVTRAFSLFRPQRSDLRLNRYGNASRNPRSVSAPGAVDCRNVEGDAVCDSGNFVVQCVAEGTDNRVTCRGGNDAVVYLY